METLSRTSISNANVLQCPRCFKKYSLHLRQSYATCCNQPLVTVYKHKPLSVDDLASRVQSMWRYIELLPVLDEDNIVSLGEGWTKIHELKKIQAAYNLNKVYLKDESTNPTGSFKARGLSVAVSKAKELGSRLMICRYDFGAAGMSGAAVIGVPASSKGVTKLIIRGTSLPFFPTVESNS